MYQIVISTFYIKIGVDGEVVSVDWSDMKQIISAKDVKRYLRKAIKFIGK